LGKRENDLIKYNIPRNVDATHRYVEALISFMKVAIAKENIEGETELKFSNIIWTEVGPIGTTKTLRFE
jgi:hypothetical protein